MPITKQQRIYFAVLGIAAAAWAVDRFILHGSVTAPAPAQASSLLITHTAPLGPVSPLADAPAPITTLSERLDHFSAKSQDPAPMRDVFAPPAAWVPEEKPTPLAAAGPTALSQSLADFRQTHTLTAIIRAGRNSQIFMGARIIRLGEHVDGFKLVSVTESTATFDYQGSPAVLELSDLRHTPTAPQPVSRNAN